MYRELFNRDWVYRKDTGRSIISANVLDGEAITLPHDAMIAETCTIDAPGGNSNGYYPNYDYLYGKKFFVPADWEGKIIALDFEGIYRNSKIFINGDYAGKRPNGYAGFVVYINDLLKYGEENEITVLVKNGFAPNSRWYTGSGIYRDVHLLVSDPLRIEPYGVKVTTKDVDPELAGVLVEIAMKSDSVKVRKVTAETVIVDQEGKIVASAKSPITFYAGAEVNIRQRLDIESPCLWSEFDPYLYRYQVTITENEQQLDKESGYFGVRTLRIDRKHGLRINGIETKLRGACIHSDNGVLGIASFPDAELRKARQLKAAGFNAVRSAHNPLGRAMLDACDQVGLYVLDELFDTYHSEKTKYDYTLSFEEWWEKDCESIVEKDYNHPSVIIYSTGNEIDEIGTARGAALQRKIVDKIRSLDDTRFITNAFNGLFMGIRTGHRPPEGDRFEDTLAKLPMVAENTEESYADLDIAGYNYMAARYAIDGELFPNRIILGTEDDPDDIVRLWTNVMKYPYVIGDMTWTGYDFLGEAGIYNYHYSDTPPQRVFGQSHWPDRVSYIGDIDLIGNRRSMSYYREIAYGLRKEPFLAVRRVDHYGQFYNKSKWMGEDTIPSWTWHGYEGKPAIVDVFSNADEVELFINDVSAGRKTVDRSRNTATFNVAYYPGELTAINYRNGLSAEKMTLFTAKPEVQLDVRVEKDHLSPNGADLAYIDLSLIDEEGRVNMFVQKEVSVKVDGVCTLQGFGTANPIPQPEHKYTGSTWPTYDGHALAVIRAGFEEGETTVTFSADGCESVSVVLYCTK